MFDERQQGLLTQHFKEQNATVPSDHVENFLLLYILVQYRKSGYSQQVTSI